MERVNGTVGVKLLECVNPIRNKWRIRWDIQPGDSENAVSYMEAEFNHKPTTDEVKGSVIGWYNSQIDDDIVSGFRFGDNMVWLSQENQFNYKASYDLAVQTGGASLPVTFKFGTDDSPVYHTFSSLDEFTDFYTKAMQHVQSTLASGWKKKDTFDLNMYQ